MSRLDDLVNEYQHGHKQGFDDEINNMFRNDDLESIILAALRGVSSESNKKSHNHQKRVSNKQELYEKITEITLKHEENDRIISKPDSFESIFNLFKGIQKEFKGFGSLGAYDTTLRLAARLRIYPDVVYLQQGAKQGAMNLLESDYRKMRCIDSNKHHYIELSTLPIELHELTPHHIERFLCIYKHKLTPEMNKSKK